MTKLLGKSVLVLLFMILLAVTLGVTTMNLLLLIKLSEVALPILMSI